MTFLEILTRHLWKNCRLIWVKKVKDDAFSTLLLLYCDDLKSLHSCPPDLSNCTGKKSSSEDSCTLQVEVGWPFDKDKLLHQKPWVSMLQSIKPCFPSTSSYKYPSTWVWSSCNHGILSCQYHCIRMVLPSGYVIPSPVKANTFW